MVIVRIAYVTESFPPDVNGVAHTAVRVAEHLVNRGHQPLIIAPEPASGRPHPDAALDYPVVRVRSLAVPGYPGFRVGVPGPRVRVAVASQGAELIHLAGPFVLGAGGGAVARRLKLPAVAVYATDMPAYARLYHTGPAGQAICWRTASSGSGCGAGAWTASGSIPPSAAPGGGPSSPRPESCWSDTSGGWRWRSASTCWLRWRRFPACGW